MPPFYNYATAITKDNAVNIVRPGDNCVMAGIYVGGAGNIVAVFQDDSVQTFTGALAGTILPISVKRVNSTNTTATNLIALWQL